MKLSNMVYRDGIGKQTQVKFGGLNHTLGAADGELWDMQNLTSDNAPLISTRAPRYQKNIGADAGGIFWHGAICFVLGKDFYYDWEVKGQVTEGKKTLCAMGAYIVIFPDKCYYNIKSGEFGDLESVWSGQSVKFTNGTIYGEEAKCNTIICPDVIWSDYFRVGDAVQIEGCETHSENNRFNIIREMEGDTLRFSEDSFQLNGDNGDEEYTEPGEITISRKVPDLRYLCENENRLWGCTEDEIFCCKMSDIFNWYSNDGLKESSWSTGVGSVGPFTGCFAYKGFPIFFKEDHVYKIYGSFATEFQALGSATLGLAEGCSDSLAIAGEALFYLSRTGVVTYTGGIPQHISSAFGTERFSDGVAGSDGMKYYISMTGENGERWLYAFDTQKGMWHKEDESDAVGFVRWEGAAAMLLRDGWLQILDPQEAVPEGFEKEDPFSWYCEFSDFTNEEPNKKRVVKLQIRMELEADACAQVYLQCDSNGAWLPVGTKLGDSIKRSYYLPIVPRRCDHYRIRIEGTGRCYIHSLSRLSSTGSAMKSTIGRN